MKQILLFFCLIWSAFGFGQNNSLLYSIKSPDGKTSFLYGTMHIVPDSLFNFSSKLKKALDKSDELVMEIGELNPMAAMSLMKLESGSCFDIFTKEQKDSVITWGAKEMNLDPKLFEMAFSPMKPIALMQISTQKMMSGDVKMVETELTKYVGEKPTAGLETVEQQLGFFDSLSNEQVVKMLMDPIRHPESTNDVFIELMKAYQQQDIDQLAVLVSAEESTEFPTEDLIVNRNKRWIPQIQEMMKSKICFFAVGAGHLGGKDGVIKLLQDAGYEVKPIKI